MVVALAYGGSCRSEASLVIHFYAMSDLHISKKMGRISRALNKCVDGQFLLLAGDLTNDGKDAQFLKLKEILEKEISEIPVFSVSGNVFFRCTIFDSSPKLLIISRTNTARISVEHTISR